MPTAVQAVAVGDVASSATCPASIRVIVCGSTAVIVAGIVVSSLHPTRAIH